MRENSKSKRNDFMELMLQLKKFGTVNPDKETVSANGNFRLKKVKNRFNFFDSV